MLKMSQQAIPARRAEAAPASVAPGGTIPASQAFRPVSGPLHGRRALAARHPRSPHEFLKCRNHRSRGEFTACVPSQSVRHQEDGMCGQDGVLVGGPRQPRMSRGGEPQLHPGPCHDTNLSVRPPKCTMSPAERDQGA